MSYKEDKKFIIFESEIKELKNDCDKIKSFLKLFFSALRRLLQ
jgi:hypothetical protein